jgi:perosamine synthetase
MDALTGVANRHGLLIVEDAAEAFLSKCNGKCLGTLGAAGCFSLSPNKTITTGQGGLVATDDERLHVRLRELKDQGRPVRGTGGDDAHNSVGYNFKFTDMQAAVGLAQLRDVPRRIERMKGIYRGYRDGLRGVQDVSVIPFRIEEGELPQWTDVLVNRRDDLYDHLAARGMRGRRFWHPLHTQKPYQASAEQFPNSARQVPRAMWLPSAFILSDEDVAAVCAEIRNFAGPQEASAVSRERVHGVS